MVVKIYISGISGNKEVKKRQQRVLMILDSKNVEYQIIDITEPGKEDEKEFMQANSTVRDSKHPLPPQIFNDFDYCGDYEDFDLANELDELEKFLKPAILDDSVDVSNEKDEPENNEVRQNGNTSSREISTDKDVSVVHSESEPNDRQGSMSGADDDDDDVDKSNSEEMDKATKSLADGDLETEEFEDKTEEKSDEQEKEE